MVITALIGGLGNQLFQYALGRRLAQQLGVPLKLDASGFEVYKLHHYSLSHFAIVEELATEQELAAMRARQPLAWKARVGRFCRYLLSPVPVPPSLRGRRRVYYHEPSLAFDPAVLTLSGHVYLNGYWQDERYFADIAPLLRRELVLRHPLDDENRRVAEQIESASLAVSVHVRRADYVSNAQTTQIHGICSLDYYRRAAAWMLERYQGVTFYVFSDDPSWARANLDLGAPVRVMDHNDASRNYADLVLMSRCRHHIIANSSFSWWGAWLNDRADKQVIAPQQWFAATERAHISPVPPSWTRM